MISKRL